MKTNRKLKIKIKKIFLAFEFKNIIEISYSLEEQNFFKAFKSVFSGLM